MLSFLLAATISVGVNVTFVDITGTDPDPKQTATPSGAPLEVSQEGSNTTYY